MASRVERSVLVLTSLSLVSADVTQLSAGQEDVVAMTLDATSPIIDNAAQPHVDRSGYAGGAGIGGVIPDGVETGHEALEFI